MTEPSINREEGILGFNERVLAQARDQRVPLLERLRFISIVSNNLDEFFEVRIAALQKSLRDHSLLALDGEQQLDALTRRAKSLIEAQYALLQDEIFPALEAQGIRLFLQDSWTPQIRQWAHSVFESEVEPLLTPIALDPAHPFPRILNKSLNFIVELSGTDAFGRAAEVAIVQAPRALPRVLKMPEELSAPYQGMMLLSSIVQGFVQDLFPGMEIRGVHQFRVTRNSDISVDEDEVSDKRDALADELVERNFGDPVRLEVSSRIPDRLVRLLRELFELPARDVYRVPGFVNLMRLAQIIDLVDRPDLKHPGFVPSRPHVLGSDDIFSTLRERDILLHHPYESFAPVVDFLGSTATDPNVIAIKQTVYRTGSDSVLMRALETAARAGKEVTVIVELMARFDEETNINWADRLEKAGAHVVYGVVGLKTHAKMALIVRREGGRLKRYAHLGTGNYNPRTATLYEDFSLLTADEHLCADVHEVFRRLTGVGVARRLNDLLQAPFNLHGRILEAIKGEIAQARAGKPAYIGAKVNALTEARIIQSLYEASQEGVKVDLVVRGVCSLVPGLGSKDCPIRVRSTIGRFLEHSRLFCFHAGGREEVFLSSSDWMERNFFRRVELAFPIKDPALKARVLQEGLRIHFEDREGSWVMREDGTYEPRTAVDGALPHAHLHLMQAIPQV